VISLTQVMAASSNDIFNPFSGNPATANDTKNAASGKYFRDLLKKVTNTSSIETNGNRILSEQELIAVVCDLEATYNSNDTAEGCNLDKKHKIMLGEMRKLNIKLIRLDNKLDSFIENMTKMIKTEMKTLKDEITSLRNNDNRN
jgi:hypothetical protein